MGVAAASKCNEGALWKDKEREEFGGFNHQFLYVGYIVANTLYTTRKVVKGDLGASPQKNVYKCISYNAGKCPFASFPDCIQGCHKNPLVGGF